VKVLYGCLLLCGALALGGCTWSGSASLDEEKEPHFLEGKSRVNMLDYAGALESFEQALEVNPKSAAAHFEIGCLCDQREADPAAAIYHYGRYLKLRPRGEKAERARERIGACQQQLASMVSVGPVTQTLQRDQEALTERNKQLTEENRMLRDRVEKLEGMLNAPRMAANAGRSESVTQVSASRTAEPPQGRSQPAENSRALMATGRTHTVSSGETPAAIAKRYGIRVETLMAANPRLEPRRMRVGQTLAIPSS
jgi:tetratricopeptide (TPR) repeat protein